MSDFTLMRQNMVKGQVLPEEVTHPYVIEALTHIPRERFVPRQLARIAYMDANFPYSKGRVLLRPATLAHLLEELNPSPNDKILYIGGGTGYGPALLGYMGAHVIALDSEETLTQKAEQLLEDLKLSLVHIVLGPLTEGWKNEAPYHKIIIEGCIDFIPKSLFSQLREDGIMVTLRHSKSGKIEAIKLVQNEGMFTEIPLFDAFAPRLETFRKRKAFDF
ncbi:MAG: protein-L-isoaspartate O-methyltransferase [Alphaproteobacteria bacterium]|nr:protein-L-isoaspartate O-methyltransferase [Alphaproteobacteria bacterium]